MGYRDCGRGHGSDLLGRGSRGRHLDEDDPSTWRHSVTGSRRCRTVGCGAMTTTPLEHLIALPEPSGSLPNGASVAIVGGGIMGASIAFHLAQAGVEDIVLVERDTLGSGSSAKPLGGVRATFS